MLNSVGELHSYIDQSQLTQELGGTLQYCHNTWISHRTVRSCTLYAVALCLQICLNICFNKYKFVFHNSPLPKCNYTIVITQLNHSCITVIIQPQHTSKHTVAQHSHNHLIFITHCTTAKTQSQHFWNELIHPTSVSLTKHTYAN